MKCVSLHTVPNLYRECAELLNEEWKRSLTARLHSLEKSCDTMPVCLVLLDEDQTSSSVVGHSRLSHIQGQANKSCLVESVVVRKSLRGKGYGRKLMEKTEEYAASKGYKTMYLTTHDKQEFYKHLGYEFCSPIVCYDSTLVPEHLAQRLLGNLTVSGDSAKSLQDSPCRGDAVSANTDKTSKSTEKENLSKSCNNSAAPPAPPPPPVPSQEKGSKTNVDEKTVVRWDPKLVCWMKKDLQGL